MCFKCLPIIANFYSDPVVIFQLQVLAFVSFFSFTKIIKILVGSHKTKTPFSEPFHHKIGIGLFRSAKSYILQKSLIKMATSAKKSGLEGKHQKTWQIFRGFSDNIYFFFHGLWFLTPSYIFSLTPPKDIESLVQ